MTRSLLATCLALFVLQGSLLGQEWVLPERSQANLDALARVELRTYEMLQADGAGNEFNRRREDPGPDNLGELSEMDVMNVLGIRKEYNVDDRRIYLIGQSMGGGGTWHLGRKAT